jgi:predicted ATP-dependent endonuclease of OLD family
MEKQKYKLIGLQIENLRLIKACFLQFKEKGLTEIIGKNNQGKSTLIDAIEILFKGFKEKPDDMIAHGADKAVIIGDLGDFTIKRIMGKSDRLEIMTKNGMKPSKPQDFLDTLINKLTFRPQVFLDKKPEEKLKSVMEILKIDFTEENGKITEKTSERLLTGRERDNLGTKIEPEKVDAVDTADLLKQQTAIKTHNDSEKLKKDDIDFFTNIKNDVAGYLKANKDNSSVKAGLLKLEKTIKDVIEAMPTPEYKSSADIDKQISTASATNIKAQAYKDYLTWQTNKTKKQTDYDKLTKDISDLRQKKIQKLKDTPMPVKGLEIKEVTEGVYGLFYQDIFCENWSTSLGWRISLAICTAMQPDLKALFLDQGESLDPDSRKELDVWAVKNDVQVILTVVEKIPDSLEAGKFYIEQGNIFNTDGDCIPKQPEPDQPDPEPEKTKDKPKIDTQSLF